MDPEDYAELVTLWEISLRGANKSAETVKSYVAGARGFASWCAEDGRAPSLTLGSAEAYVAALLGAGKSSSTATVRQLAVRRFSAWLESRDEIARDELSRMRPPKLDQKVVDALTVAQLSALLAACGGKRFIDIRDTAIVRFMAATGVRADELCGLGVIDMQIGAGSAVVVRGKGGRGRRVGYGLKTADALGRYARMRKRHPLAGRPEFWLAERRRVLNYQALYATLRRRAAAAGIDRFHPHQLRHTMAVNWVRAGGSESGLMAQGGWSNSDLVRRYLGHARSELAVEESQRLGLDDF